METTGFVKITASPGMVLMREDADGSRHLATEVFALRSDFDGMNISEITENEAEAIRAEQEAAEQERMRNEEARGDGTDH